MLCFLMLVLATNDVANGLVPEGSREIGLIHELTQGGEDAPDEQIFSGTTT